MPSVATFLKKFTLSKIYNKNQCTIFYFRIVKENCFDNRTEYENRTLKETRRFFQLTDSVTHPTVCTAGYASWIFAELFVNFTVAGLML